MIVLYVMYYCAVMKLFRHGQDCYTKLHLFNWRYEKVNALRLTLRTLQVVLTLLLAFS